MRIVLLTFLTLMLTGCLVRTAATIVTAPIKVGSAVVDAATTSQSEADEKRGREMRKAEEREVKTRKRAEKEERRRAREADDDLSG
jgi:predicted Holliday junction resolvase-like endonuclease